MARLKKFFVALALLLAPLLFGFFSTQLVFAEELNTEVCDAAQSGPDAPVICRDSTSNTSNPIFGPEGIITKVAQGIIYAVGVVSVIIIIVGGIRYIASAGDPNGTKGAKDSILYALVGLVVALFAQALVAFVLSRL